MVRLTSVLHPTSALTPEVVPELQCEGSSQMVVLVPDLHGTFGHSEVLGEAGSSSLKPYPELGRARGKSGSLDPFTSEKNCYSTGQGSHAVVGPGTVRPTSVCQFSRLQQQQTERAAGVL